MPAWTPRAREPSPRLRARLRCPRNLPDYLPGLRARALGEVVSPRDEPAAGNLHGGVCEGGVPRCRHGGPKRARSRKRWKEAKGSLQPTESPLLGAFWFIPVLNFKTEKAAHKQDALPPASTAPTY